MSCSNPELKIKTASIRVDLTLEQLEYIESVLAQCPPRANNSTGLKLLWMFRDKISIQQEMTT